MKTAGNGLSAICCIVALCAVGLPALLEPASASPTDNNTTLIKAVLLLRHGVRSPTSTPQKLAPFAAQPWPAWDVPPGHLTAHGKHDITLLGAFYREYFVHEGLFDSGACNSSDRIAVHADSDQRTRETAAGFLDGFAPSCNVTVVEQAEGVNDPLFHPQRDDEPKALVPASIFASLGSSFTAAANVTQAPAVFDPPRGLANGATIAENLQLEYEEGFSGSRLGWGRLTEANLYQIMRLHVVSFSLQHRDPASAAASATPMLDAIRAALLGPHNVLTVLVGHDSNVAAVGQLLGLHWTLPGYQSDDTPPGGGLLFELRKRPDGSEFVRIAYIAQSLEQMRNAETLTLQNPPEGVDVATCPRSLDLMTCQLLPRTPAVSPYGN